MLYIDYPLSNAKYDNIATIYEGKFYLTMKLMYDIMIYSKK